MSHVLVLVSAPADPLLSLDEAKRHLRVDHDEDNAQIAALVSAVASVLDPASGGWLGRALRPQTWRLELCGFPSGEIVLPYPPLRSIGSFAYTDRDCAEQPVPVDTGYRIVHAGALARAVLAPPYRGAWPTARADHDAVRVTYTAGYPVTDAADTMPEAIKAWAKLQLGTLWERRETVAAGPVADLGRTFDALIWPFRVF